MPRSISSSSRSTSKDCGCTLGARAVAYRRRNERTIIIESIKPNPGGWTAQGRYGITGEKLGRQSYDISLQDNDLIIQFVTGAKSPARPKLVGDDKLEGTLNIVTKAGSPNRTFKLEKVQPKAGDVK
jgi:hypothetical protein